MYLLEDAVGDCFICTAKKLKINVFPKDRTTNACIVLELANFDANQPGRTRGQSLVQHEARNIFLTAGGANRGDENSSCLITAEDMKQTYAMAESEAYFEAYRHVLSGLQGYC